jgi:hypothetical protein
MTTLCDILYRKYVISPYQHPAMLTPEYMKTSEYIDTGLENYKYIQTNNTLLYILSSSFIYGFLNTKKTYLQEKYTYLKSVLDNPFLTDIQKNDFLLVFQDIQCIYNILCKIAFRCKWKKSKYANHHDLIMNPINENKYFVCTLMHYNTKYMFTKSDLTKIIENSLINSPYIYAEPLPIKNPYNNSIFGKSHLYTIYFFMKHGGFILPGIFHQYFVHNFHLKIFRDNTECMIREMHIKTMLTSNSNTQLEEDIQTMIQLYNKQCIKRNMRIVIDNSFPPDILIRAMKPYLHLFYTSNYTLCTSKMSFASNELAYRLNAFKKDSPLFGRKFIKLQKYDFTNKRTKTYEYNTTYKPYIEAPYCKNYETSHNEIIEDNSDEEKEHIIPMHLFDRNGFIMNNNFIDMSDTDMDISGNDMDISGNDNVNTNLYTTVFAGINYNDDFDDEIDDTYDD